MDHIGFAVDKLWATTITYEELTGERPKIDDLREVLRPFSLSAVLLGISRLTAMLGTWKNELPAERDDRFCAELLPELNWRIRAVRKKGELQRVLLNRPALLYTIQQACLVCAQEGRLVESQADVGRVVLACLMANDLFTSGDAADPPTTLSLAARLLPYSDYISRDLYGQETARSLILFEDILPQREWPQRWPDPLELFENKFGVKLREYCELALACSTRFTVGVDEQFDSPHDALILNNQYFRSTSLSEDKITRFLSGVSASVQRLVEEVRRFDNQPNNFTALQTYPLVEFEPGRYICLDPGFLLDKSGKALFWSVAAQLDDGGKVALLDLWGLIFEDYLAWIIRRAYRGRGTWITKTAFSNGAEAFDIIYRNGSVAILIEAKASVVKATAKHNFDEQSLKRELDLKFIEGSPQMPKGVRQIERGLQRLLDGEIVAGRDLASGDAVEFDLEGVSTIYPLLAVLDSTFMSPLMARYLNERFVKPISGSRFHKRRVTPLFVLHVTDFEDLLPMTATIELEEALRESWKVNKDSPYPLRFQSIPLLQTVARGYDPLREKYDEFCATLQQRTFGTVDQQ